MLCAYSTAHITVFLLPAACCAAVSPAQDVRGDIFAFGLCMLELLTLKQLDPQHCLEVPQLLTQVRVHGLSELVNEVLNLLFIPAQQQFLCSC
jgi:hypothetical protein